MQTIRKLFLLISLIFMVFIGVLYLTKTRKFKDNPPNINPGRLWNIPFEYRINNEKVCQEADLLAVFIVTSYFGNVETRSSIRRAFDKESLRKRGLRRVFLLGQVANDTYTTQQVVESEARRFGDIVQGSFVEAYRNLTYKHVMGLKWAGAYCSNAQFVIKMDDDTVVNLHRLDVLLDSLNPRAKNRFIAGYKLDKMKPIREPQNKWYVTQAEYSANTYPRFVSGWFYITTPLLSKKLAALAQQEKFFWIDDVFITGLLARKLAVILFDISQHFAVNAEYLQCCLQDFRRQLDCDFLLGPNGGHNDMFSQFNDNYYGKCVEHQCEKRQRPLNETCVAEKKVNLGRGLPLVHAVGL